MDKRAAVILSLGITLLVALMVLVMARGGSKWEPSSIVPLIPIWVAVWIAVANNRKRQQRAHIKRKHEDMDFYSMMSQLVDDLDADEVAYLKQRLLDRHGPFEADDRLQETQQ